MMDWFKENPFLAAVASIIAVAVVGGGILVYSAAGGLEEQQAAFDEKTAQLQQLRSNKPFPDQANVDATKREAEEASAALQKLAKDLAVTAPAASPQSFQDDLAKMMKSFGEKAAAGNISLPADFYLGFEKYRDQPPSAEVAPKLALQLQTIHAVAEALLDAKVRSIGAIQRGAVDGETPAAGEGEAPAPQEKRQKSAAAPSFEVVPFDISFVSDQSAFRYAFNKVLAINPPVFVRLVAIDNSAPAPPAKASGAPAAEASPTEAGKDAEGGIKPVVGRESLSVNLRLAGVVSSGGKPTP